MLKKLFLILLCATAGSAAMLDTLHEADEPSDVCRLQLPNGLMSAALASSIGSTFCFMKAIDYKYNFFHKCSEGEKINPKMAFKYLLAGIALKTGSWGLLSAECNKNEFAVPRFICAETASTSIGIGLYALETAYLKYHHAKKEYHMIKELRQEEALKDCVLAACFISMGLLTLPTALLECD